MIIGIAGKKGSGKDTAGQYLITKHGFRRYAFGDPVKEVCRLLFGFTDEQLYGTQKEEMTELGIRPREAFQKIGTDFGRNYLHNLLPELKVKEGEVWIDIFRRECPIDKLIVVTDVRFQNEADAIKDKGGIILYVVRDECEKDGHESERIDVEYDHLLENNRTLEEFYDKIDRIFNNYD